MPGTVVHQPSCVFIEQVTPFSYAMGRDSLALAIQSAAAALGREVPYARLKGLSGLAFRLIFHQDWHRYTPDALCGFDHTALAFDPLGLSAEHLVIAPAAESGDDHAEARGRIAASIEAGYPVLAMHLMDWEDWGVIAGYAGESYLCRTPHDAPGAWTVNRQFPCRILLIRGERDCPELHGSVLRSLRAAVELFETGSFGPYYSGRAAYRFWVEGLRDQQLYARLGEAGSAAFTRWAAGLRAAGADQFKRDVRYNNPYLERAHVNAWRLESLIDARGAAEAYLREIAGTFAHPLADLLRQSADYYGAAAAYLRDARPFAPWDWQLEQTAWGPEKRTQQANLLEAALECEEQAVERIKAVVEQME